MGGNVKNISKSSVWRFNLLMILVMLGTQNNSFHRLLEKIEELIKDNIIKDEVVVQAGYTKFKSDYMQIFDMIPREELEEYQKQADLIITHGGVGSIITSLKLGKKVIAVPRLHEYGEHVNNHQIEIVELFDKKGYILGCMDVDKLENTLQKVEEFIPKKYELDNHRMLNTIEEFIDKV